jgi:hypothetical protein
VRNPVHCSYRNITLLPIVSLEEQNPENISSGGLDIYALQNLEKQSYKLGIT